MTDSYRPSYDPGPPPPPPALLPPPPPSRGNYHHHHPPPPPPSFPASRHDARATRHQSTQQNQHYAQHGQPPAPGTESSFTFEGQSNNPAARSEFTFQAESSYSRNPQHDNNLSQYDHGTAARRQRYHGHGGRGSRGGVDRYKKPGASERALLRFARDETPEQMEGMNANGEAKFLDPDVVTDSEEEEMEGTDQEDEVDQTQQDSQHPLESQDLSQASVNDQPPAPKWSNLEIYTSLPPPDEGARKKTKDMVKLIRKARVSAKKDDDTDDAVASTADDFISFGIDMDDDDYYGKAPKDAPSGPSATRGSTTSDTRLYVGNLAFAATEQDLRTCFARFNLQSVTLPTNAQTGRSYGYAFVECAKPEDATAAVKEMHGASILDRPVKVDYCKVNHAGTNGHARPAALDATTRCGAADIGERQNTEPERKETASLPTAPRLPQAVVEIMDSTVVNDSIASFLQRGRKRKLSFSEQDHVNIKRPSKSLKVGQKPDGYLRDEWELSSGQAVLPWLTEDHRTTTNVALRLHKEICDFYEFVCPRPYEQRVREDLLHRLRRFLLSVDDRIQLEPFGSFAAGLYLPNADIDVAVLSQEYLQSGVPDFCQSKRQMFRLRDDLIREGIAEKNVEVIASAKVPILKFIDKESGIKVDMCFENDSGVKANQTFQQWKAQYPAMPIIVTLIKQFLMMRGLNEVVNGGLGGFSITCLVTSLMQLHPRIQTKELIPEQNLGEILLEFLDLYGNQLDLSRTGLRMNPPGYVEKNKMPMGRGGAKSGRLTILDPNREDHDISVGSTNVAMIFQKFAAARSEILRAMQSTNTKRQTFLDWMLGGSYDSFTWSRRHLRKLHDKKWGSCYEHK